MRILKVGQYGLDVVFVAEVAGATIRVRILKVAAVVAVLLLMLGCRGYDPGEDTESREKLYGAHTHSVGCRGYDPGEDTERHGLQQLKRAPVLGCRGYDPGEDTESPTLETLRPWRPSLQGLRSG